MQVNTQRTLILSLIIIIIILSFQTCKKDVVYPNPMIVLSIDAGYLSGDTTLLLGEEIKIKVIAETKSDEPLTNLHIEIDKDAQVQSIDSGISTNQLIYEKTISKSTALTEKWSFFVSDRDGRKSDEISLILNLDPASIFGEITSVQSIIFGGQDNTMTGGFYSLNSNLIYSYDEAESNQDLINMLYYYDNADTDENTIASPGASIDNTIYDLSGWLTKNTSRYESEDSVTVAEFDDCSNDSLILNNTFEFSTGKRKAKKLSAGDIYSFVTEDGIKGMFKVVNVAGQETGTVEISLKMQQQ